MKREKLDDMNESHNESQKTIKRPMRTHSLQNGYAGDPVYQDCMFETYREGVEKVKQQMKKNSIETSFKKLRECKRSVNALQMLNSCPISCPKTLKASSRSSRD